MLLCIHIAANCESLVFGNYEVTFQNGITLVVHIQSIPLALMRVR